MRIVDRAQARCDSARGAEPAVQAHDDAVDVRRDHARARARFADAPARAEDHALKEVLEHYIAHRHEVIVRRTQYELDKALEREHILEGLKIAVDNIDAVIKLIRAAEDTPTASAQLQKRFKLTERQAEAILNMRLAKLTGLEIEKLEAELKEVRAFVKELRDILASKPRRMKLMRDELQKIADTLRRRAAHGDHERRRRVHDRGPDRRRRHGHHDLALGLHQAHVGHDVSEAAPRRAGLERSGSEGEDFIERLFIGSTHDYILCFTDDGRCFWLKVHEIPQAGRATKGKPIVNLINVTPDTQIKAMVPVREFNDDAVPAVLHEERHGEEDAALRSTRTSAHDRHQGDQDRAGR